jgi:molybdate transport system permease protein
MSRNPGNRVRQNLHWRSGSPAYGAVLTALAGGMALVLVVPVLALAWRSLTLVDASDLRGSGDLLEALVLSLSTTSISMAFIVLLGTPLALALAFRDFPAKRILSAVIEVPIVMPPVVAGLALLMAFGRRGLVGGSLASLGFQIPFTPLAVVLAQVFVAAPFYIRSAQARFAALPLELDEAAQIDGAAGWQTLRHVILPLSLPALLAGLMLSWARALGEFGATILFAGNLQGRTQTLPLFVYTALEQDLGASVTSAVFLLALAIVALGISRWVGRLDALDRDPLAQR